MQLCEWKVEIGEIIGRERSREADCTSPRKWKDRKTRNNKENNSLIMMTASEPTMVSQWKGSSRAIENRGSLAKLSMSTL